MYHSLSRKEVTATEKAVKALEKVAETLERYQKNKTLVPPEELAGKYKKPFQKLKEQLKAELEEYLVACIFENIQIQDNNEGQQIVKAIVQVYKTEEIGKAIGRAAFKEFDLEKIKQIVQAQQQKIYKEIWLPYFNRHTYIYITAENWDLEKNVIPKIRNEIVNKVWDEEKGIWR